MESDVQLARRCKPVCGPRLGFILSSLYFSIETEAWKNKPVCVTARKPPPFLATACWSTQLRPDPATHACRHTQPLHKRCNLIFICMTSERTNQPPAEAFSPLALETKAKLCLQRGAYQLPDIKHTYKLVQTISPPAGNSNILICLTLLIWVEFFSLLSVSSVSFFSGRRGPHGQTSADNSVSHSCFWMQLLIVKVFFSETRFSP